jgi:hypothetical protein
MAIFNLRAALIEFTIANALLIAGCASMAVTDDSIQQRTALALGVEKGEFTISNRVDDGVRSDYVATTTSGKVYNCYVEGTVSITGRIVSDALCSEKGKAANKSLSPGTSCNDLLKAAGKC